MTLVIYRQSAPDVPSDEGFCCAFIAWLKFGFAAEYIPSEFHERLPLETFKDRDVVFLDITYPREKMDAIYEVAKSLKVIDHHLSSKRAFEGAPYAVIDTTSSGCACAWKYFFPAEPMPVLVQHISDYDLHEDLDAHAKAFMLKLRTLPYDFQQWDVLNRKLGSTRSAGFYTDFVFSGLPILESYDIQCSRILASAFPITLNGVKGLAVNAPKFFATDLGFRLAQDSGTFGAVLHIRKDGRVEMQLRSKTVDVETLASAYGGGGYRSSAGMSVNLFDYNCIVDSSMVNLHIYSQTQTALEMFACSKFSAEDFTKEKLEARLLSHLNVMGLVSNRLMVDVAVVNIDSHRYLRKLGRFLARVLKLPEVTNTRRWYHKVLPYQVSTCLDFEEEQIAQLLSISKYESDNKTINHILTDLMETVNYLYKAELKRDRHKISAVVRFHDSNIYVKRHLEV